MKETKIAFRYAKALFDLATEEKNIEKVQQDMLLLHQVCNENRDLHLMLLSPIIQADKKQAVLSAIFSSSFSPLSISFMAILTKKRREFYLSDIALQYQELFKAYKGIQTVIVTTATPLDKEQKDKITLLVKTASNATIDLVEKVDASIIGGFILNMDNKQYDASIQSRLHELAKKFEN